MCGCGEDKVVEDEERRVCVSGVESEERVERVTVVVSFESCLNILKRVEGSTKEEKV